MSEKIKKMHSNKEIIIPHKKGKRRYKMETTVRISKENDLRWLYVNSNKKPLTVPKTFDEFSTFLIIYYNFNAENLSYLIQLYNEYVYQIENKKHLEFNSVTKLYKLFTPIQYVHTTLNPQYWINLGYSIEVAKKKISVSQRNRYNPSNSNFGISKASIIFFDKLVTLLKEEFPLFNSTHIKYSQENL